MKCPKCGNELPSNSKFCLNCGSKIEPSILICPKCGKELPKDSLFCDKCGARVGDSISESNRETSKEKSNNMLRVIVVGIILALIVGVVMFVLLNRPGNSEKNKTPESEVKKEETTEVKNEEDSSDVKTDIEETKSDLKVLETGYTITKKDSAGNSYLYYGLEFENKSNDAAIGWVSVTITCRDKNGDVISTYDSSGYTCLDGGKTGGISGMGGEINQKPESVSFSFDFKAPAEYDYPNINQIDRVDIVGTKIKRDDYYSTVTGDVVNNSKKEIDNAEVYIIFKNDDGKIIGGEEIYVDSLKPGKNPFQYSLLAEDIVTDDYSLYGVGTAN